MSPERGGGYAPPWVWAPAIPGYSYQEQPSVSLPASDPSSAWHGMYQGGGPFSHQSQWDSNNGTYEGGTDWGTLLGTAGVGAIFAAPAIMALMGSGGAAGAGAATGEAGATAGLPAASALPGYTAAPTVGGMMSAAAANAPEAGIVMGNGLDGGSALGSATSALLGNGNVVKGLAGLAAALGGHAIASATGANNVPPQLTDLLNQSVQRQKELAPLGTAATAGMYQMLPDFAKTPQAMQGAQSLLGVKANG
jgi:hypothetical protein